MKRALRLALLLLLVPATTLAGNREGWYIGAPNGIFAPPPSPPGQRPHFYIGGPVGTFAPPAQTYPSVPYTSYGCYSVPGYWTYYLVTDDYGNAYYQPYWMPARQVC